MQYGVGAVVIALLAFGCDGERASDADDITKRCTRMRDHVIDLRLASTELRSSQAPQVNMPGAKTAPVATSPPARRWEARPRFLVQADPQGHSGSPMIVEHS